MFIYLYKAPLTVIPYRCSGAMEGNGCSGCHGAPHSYLLSPYNNTMCKCSGAMQGNGCSGCASLYQCAKYFPAVSIQRISTVERARHPQSRSDPQRSIPNTNAGSAVHFRLHASSAALKWQDFPTSYQQRKWRRRRRLADLCAMGNWQLLHNGIGG